ncbi:DUF1045 domain-containing protein [Oceanicola sp. S124]|uniref:DUF1045 domain-containing protein n=1 Tax=Oceanicola sp. S124 TaxID=1042378 RepID=UPI0002558525|nr:DUF1045 domain-containing protein [Oceanicola sp. S124]
MPDYARYAIYYLPEPGPLADFGAAWLGWDVQGGAEVAHPQVPALPRPVAELTATPRKYGFHGTVKPPFRLAEGHDAAGLALAAERLAERLEPVVLDGLALTRLGSFIALTPRGSRAQLTALAALASESVQGLDAYRAPAPQSELDRRRKAGLSARQESYLQQWGYPYVMEEFRFHLTLTGKLSAIDAPAVEAALRPVVAPVMPEPFTIESLCLCGEDEAGRFHLVKRLALGG